EIEEKTAWLADNLELKPLPSLQKNITADIAIIGSGITGITTAYVLSKTKKSVVVLEKADVTQSASAYTTAFITSVIDTGLSELVSMFGEEKARLVWQSGDEAIAAIEKIVGEENIACEFMRCAEYQY